MSGQQPATREPFRYAEDYEPYSEQTVNEAIPLITPVQRYMLEGLDKISKAQGVTNERLNGVEATLTAIVPRLEQLEKHAAWWQKGVAVFKYAAFGLATRYFPELAASVAKYAPAILDAAGKAP